MDIILVQLNENRLDLDRILKTIEENGDSFRISSYEGFAHNEVKKAFMWLGKAKGIIGSANPYPESTDPASKRIEAAVDIYEGEIQHFDKDEEVELLKTLRRDLGVVEDRLKNMLSTYLKEHTLYQLALSTAYIYTCEAKMSFGLCLGEIRHANPPSKQEPQFPEPGPEEEENQSGTDPGVDGVPTPNTATGSATPPELVTLTPAPEPAPPVPEIGSAEPAPVPAPEPQANMEVMPPEETPEPQSKGTKKSQAKK